MRHLRKLVEIMVYIVPILTSRKPSSHSLILKHMRAQLCLKYMITGTYNKDSFLMHSYALTYSITPTSHVLHDLTFQDVCNPLVARFNSLLVRCLTMPVSKLW